MTELTGVLMSADLDAIQSRGSVDSFLDHTNRDEQFNKAPRKGPALHSALASVLAQTEKRGTP